MGHRTSYLFFFFWGGGGANLTPSSHISEIIQYKTLVSKKKVSVKIHITYMKQFSIISLKREEKTHCIIGAHPGFDPGPLVP